MTFFVPVAYQRHLLRVSARLRSIIVADADEYFLGYRQAEQERLQRQAQELEQKLAGCSIRLVSRSGRAPWRSAAGRVAVWICSPSASVRPGKWSAWNEATRRSRSRGDSSPSA